MATSKVVSRPSSLLLEDDEDYMKVPDRLKSETRAVLYEFLVERADHDDKITHEQRCTLHESTVECIREESDTEVQVSLSLYNILYIMLFVDKRIKLKPFLC